MATPRIRRARPDDAQAMRACAAAAYHPYIALIGRKPAPMVADFDSQITAGQVCVATTPGDTLAGFIVFFPKDEVMFLENVAVFPAMTGQGIGKALIAHCEAQARHQNLSRVTLYTNEKMAANLRLYPHLGYRETDRRREDGFHRVYFEKHLT